MRLIGAGLPRTATLSQKVALEQLGLAPCYHMVSVLADLTQVQRWRDAFDGSLAPGDVVAGHAATVDWPGAGCYADLIDAFPDAKVLLSVRDGDTWAKSMSDTVQCVVHGEGLLGHMSAARACVDPRWHEFTEMVAELWRRTGLPEAGDITPASMGSAMRRYNEEVQAAVPAERLLVWSPADGWEPLCAFLELPVPDGPFPHVNDSREFGERIVDGALAVIGQHRQSGAAA